MIDLKPGDKISCRIKDYIIVSPYSEYDNIFTFEIVAVDEYGYYLFVPKYLVLKSSIKADKSKCKYLNINEKFTDEYIAYIHTGLVFNVKSILDGISCFKCKEFFDMAEPNQEDGTMICWSCKNNRYR